MVHEREDVVGLDASIMMRPEVWKSSGHLSGFSDPLVDCRSCKTRFRADKAPQHTPGSEIEYVKNGTKIKGIVSSKGYVCPTCQSTDLSDERQFNLMFRTSIGPVDPLEEFVQEIQGQSLSKELLREKLDEAIKKTAIYLRPETAQAMFVQFQNVQQSMSMKIPFGIAQIGKSFRNEVTTEKFIFRSCEFEQMEMEYFVEPGTDEQFHAMWSEERLAWWKRLSNNKDAYRLRPHKKEELAHYSKACFDVEYLFPWGWDEIEGIANRTDYDLTKHAEGSGTSLKYFDPQKTNSEGKLGAKYTPFVIEPAAGLNRAVLALLCDAYCEEEATDADGATKIRTVLKLSPKIAPIKAAILPLTKKDGLPEIARSLATSFFKKGINAKYDEQQSIGKRYARHDEIGTPFCITIDYDTPKDNTATIRYRDSTKQERVNMGKIVEIVEQECL